MTNEIIKQIYEVYRMDDAYELFSFYEKDKDLNEKPLEEIIKHMDLLQQKRGSKDAYHILTEVKEKKGNLIYNFEFFPGLDSTARTLPHYSRSYTSYKIVPKLKIEQKIK